MTVSTQSEASERQVAFVRKLDAERVSPVAGKDSHEAEIIARFEDLLGGGKFVSKQEASAVITWLLAQPKIASTSAGAFAPAKPKGAPAAEGFYLHEGHVVRVQKSKGSDRRYAKRLDLATGAFEYVQGLVSQLGQDERLTVEQAASLGHQYGRCVVCGAELTVEQSVLDGIGPVCKKKWFGVEEA